MDIHQENIIPLLSWFLALIWLSFKCIRFVRIKYLLTGIIILFSFSSILKFPLPIYFVGAFGQLSITTVILIFVYFVQEFDVFNKKKILIKTPPLLILTILLIIILILQLSALLPNLDSAISNRDSIYIEDLYRWGFFTQALPEASQYNSIILCGFVLMLIIALNFLGVYAIAFSILIALGFALTNIYFSLNLFVSENLWDYLLDPLLFFYGLAKLISQIKSKILKKNDGNYCCE